MLTFRAAAATIFLAAFASAASAQQLRPRCSGVFNLCGYVDAGNAEVIASRFEMARPFLSGLAAVRIKGLWGFIRPSGEIAIEPRFQAAGDFFGARAEVALDGRAGVIDWDGNIVIPPRFGRAIPFTDDVALVSEANDATPQRTRGSAAQC